MPLVTYPQLLSVTTRVAAALGCPPDEAEIVAGALAGANLAGHDSHGIIRVEQYSKMVEAGEIVPGAPTTVLQETPLAVKGFSE